VEKGQLLTQFNNYYPKEVHQRKIHKFAEPFLGGGAVFFDIMQRFDIQNGYISDINKDLVLTYWVVQQRPDLLLDFLEQYQKEFDTTVVEKRNDLFLSVREHFNTQRFEINYKKMSDNWIPRAAQFIFLNKTCFNGLFRLNSKGGFNVPFGKYENPYIIDEINIKNCSKVLQRAEIVIGDFDAGSHFIDKDTFVYFDPPYRPLSNTSSFTTYAGNPFTDADQIKVAEYFDFLNKNKNAKLMLSNSDPKNTNLEEDFFENIFPNYNFHQVSANRSINSKGDKRGAIHELIITNYSYEPQTMAFNF
jgi:DNA adenine methylase